METGRWIRDSTVLIIRMKNDADTDEVINIELINIHEAKKGVFVYFCMTIKNVCKSVRCKMGPTFGIEIPVLPSGCSILIE